MECRNCRKAKVCRPRGLCWRCYYTPGLKARFLPSKYAGGAAREERERAEDGFPPTVTEEPQRVGRKASPRRCRTCPGMTYNASLNCVHCIRILEAA